MSFKKITAIVNYLLKDKLVQAFDTHGITGYSVQLINGRGEYRDLYSSNNELSHLKFEIYTSELHADNIVNLINEIADLGIQNEGLISITPVERLQWIKGKKPAREEEFRFTQ